jgi:hypothetical protein
MVYFDVTSLGISGESFVSKLEDNGILSLKLDKNKVRMVTHRGIEKEHVKKAIAVMNNIADRLHR